MTGGSGATLTIVGCGRVGKTLARVLSRAGLRVQDVINRSIASTQKSVEWLGTGRAVEHFAALSPADYVLVATSDAALPAIGELLAASPALRPGTIVFHGSGSVPAEVLSPARTRGAHIASAHPVKSFADPQIATASFAGTFCGLEGDAVACEALSKLFEMAGARVFRLNAEHKLLYHAGMVLASNYLITLIETSLRCLEAAGVERRLASELLEPIIGGTLENQRALGSARALTGPIARGEADLVLRQWAALQAWDPAVGQLYAKLGEATLELSRQQGQANPEALDRLRRAFATPPGAAGD